MTSFFKLPEQFRNGFKCKKRLGAVAQLNCIVCSEFGLKRKTRVEVHHFIGCGIGKKASDWLTIPLCNSHHTSGKYGEAIHNGQEAFEKKYGSQLELLKLTNQKLGCEEQYEEYYRIIELNQ